MKILFIVVAIILLASSRSESAVLFEDNFDAHPNWQPRPQGVSNSISGTVACNYQDNSTTPTSDCTTTPPPSGWNFYRATGSWWGPTYQDTIRITGQSGRGGSGKSFVVYNESVPEGDGWGADGQLTKLLDHDYPELYLRIWVYYQGGWRWDTVNDMMVKTLRSDHYVGIGDVFKNFAGGNNAPIAIYYFKHSNTYGTRSMLNSRCEPKATNYMCTPGYNTDTYYIPAQGAAPEPNGIGEPADGNWHRIDLHVKINTFTSGVPDANGIFEMRYDGALLLQSTSIKWLDTGANPSLGWNSVSLGGNAYNSYAASSTKSEQWYAIDDVVVSTTAIPDNYVIGSAVTPPSGSTTRVFNGRLSGRLH